MARATVQLHLFTDNNVPDSVGDYLRGRGHSVHRMRGHMPDNSPDPLVAMAALKAGRILVTQDKDFNNQRFMKPHLAKLSRISLVGEGATLKAALKEHIHLIEAQWARKLHIGAVRMIAFVEVGQIRFRT